MYKTPKVINDINSILLPRGCFGCNARLYRGEHFLCTVCRHNLPFTDHTFGSENAVDRIFYGRVPIQKAVSFLYFNRNGMVQNLLHYLKYKNQEAIGGFLGNWYGQLLCEDKHKPEIDLVVPVPIHPKKLKKRGYNQVTLFGKQLAKHFNAEFNDRILIKTRNTRSQTKKTRSKRWAHETPLFQLSETEFLRGKKILLVDDIVTTGATLEMCAETLRKGKDVTVYIATMAVVPKLGN